jgi:hypothetical protein
MKTLFKAVGSSKKAEQMEDVLKADSEYPLAIKMGFTDRYGL